jgi:hypothetical protein
MKQLNLQLSIAGLVLTLAAATPASSLVSFGSPAALNPDAATDSATDDGQDTDKEPAIAVADSGTALNVYASNNTLSGSVGTDFDIVVSRSTDGGRTWGTPAALNSTAGSDGAAADTQPSVVYGGDGNWMVAWTSAFNLGGSIGTDTDILASFSSDDGVTWSAPVVVNSDADSDTPANSLDQAPTLAGRGSAPRRWVVGWQKIEGATTGFYYAASSDDGATWSTRTQLGSDTTTGLSQGIDVLFADTTFVAAWSTLEDLGGLGTDTDILYSVITDGGGFVATPPAALNSDAASDTRNDKFPSLAGAGDVVAAWEGNLGVGASANDSDIYVAASSNGGVTWGTAGTLNSNAAGDTGDDEGVDVAMDGGTFVAVWSSNDDLGKTIKSDDDILTSRSLDGGATWSTVATLASTASKDKGQDEEAAIGASSGVWIAGWRSEDTLSKTLGPDDDLLYVLASADCPSVPVSPASCFEPLAPGKASLLVKDTEKKDLFKWKFANGAAVDKASDIGTPDATDDYLVCVYDQTGDSDELIIELDAFAGGNCFVKPCWKELPPGYLYKHKFGAVDTLSLKAGTDGKPKAQVKSSFGFASPGLPLSVDSTLTVQLHNQSTGACWSSEFSSASSNTANLFKAKSD